MLLHNNRALYGGEALLLRSKLALLIVVRHFIFRHSLTYMLIESLYSLLFTLRPFRVRSQL